MTSAKRPLSPHLHIYRWQLTSVLSILHRLTGVFLSLGAVGLVWWLFAAASGDQAFACVLAFLVSWPGKLLLLGWTFALFYHLANGIRHLLWDAGIGFDLTSTYATGWTVVIAAFALTALAWYCAGAPS
jgi:succinate dehydrogenase / fumarate reductase cytochrome b subunit